MTTDAQIEANRKNAKKSTGPRTQTGKDASKRNALRHGLCAEHIAIFDEDAEDFERFHASMLEAMTPLGEDEKMLADRVAMGNWRLRRVWRMEAAAMNEAALRIAHTRSRAAMRQQLEAELEAEPPQGPEQKPDAKPVPRPSAAALAAEAMHGLSDDEIEAIAVRAIEEDTEAPAAAREPSSPDTLVWPEQAMQSLSRYEAQITRDIDRAAKALRELQALRAFALAEPEAARIVETRQIRRATERYRKKYGSAERSQILSEFGLASPPQATPKPAPPA